MGLHAMATRWSSCACALVVAIGCGAEGIAPEEPGSTTAVVGSSDSGSTSSTGSSSGIDTTTSGSESSSTGPGDPVDEDPPDGDPLPPAEPFEWQWIDIEGATCRDGSPAGFAYRYGTTNSLMVFFQGGGACFNGASCLFNEAGIEQPFVPYSDGVFASRPDNPVADWHAVIVPYCTGDIHVGAQPEGADFPGGEGQRYVGWTNHGLFLSRIHPTFADVDRLLLTGSSAGGFGSGCNFERYANRFEIDDAIMIDDSGPPMADEFMSACLQDHWRESWRLSDTFLAGCGEACNDQPDGGGIVDIVPYLSETFPEASLGFVSSLGDFNIRQFYGYGTNDCADLFAVVPPDYPPELYAAGLFDLRDRYATGPQWGTFFFDDTSHTVLTSEGLYYVEAGGVSLLAWFTAMIEGAPSHVEP
jgi:hypothetical protein